MLLEEHAARGQENKQVNYQTTTETVILGALQRFFFFYKNRVYYGSGWVGPGLTRNCFVENHLKIALNLY